jgi:dTDP-4-amino-4,6-dideoxygalactose transaminase
MTAALERAGVGHGVYYEVPCHRQGPYEGSSLHLPHTDEAAVEVVSIPVRADLTEAELDHVIGTINGTAA